MKNVLGDKRGDSMQKTMALMTICCSLVLAQLLTEFF